MNTFQNQNSDSEDSDYEQPPVIDYAVDTLSKDLLEFEKDIQNTLIQNPNSNKTSKEYTLFLNSGDREINGENTTFNFEVITDEQHTPGISNISDIQKIEIVSVLIPNFYLNLQEVLYFETIIIL